MSKKNKNLNTCNGKHCGCKALPLFPGITLKVKNLHLHFDEHVESTSFYYNECCGCEEDESDGIHAEQEVQDE